MSDLPKEYKAVLLHKANDQFKTQRVDLQHPSTGEILIKVIACGLCSTDIHAGSGHMGDIFPRVPGHEFVGDIVELGAGVTNFHRGERVGGAFHAGHDSICRQCYRGHVQYCDNREINGISRDGGLAEYAILRAQTAIRIPKEMDPAEVAPLLCAGMTVFNGIRKQHLEPGAFVAVQGLGGLGHLAVQYARKMGYEVAVLSSSDEKAVLAKQLGAHHYINTKICDASLALQELGGADMIIQTVPNSNDFGTLLDGLVIKGTILVLAPIGKVEIYTDALIMKGQTIQGWLTGGPLDAEEAISFASKQGIRCMVEKYKLDDVHLAVDSLLTGRPRFRNVLVME
jgi:D-arabinose 1-dehydrogenase-like Zn-dependent alcohol dehydrogenase